MVEGEVFAFVAGDMSIEFLRKRTVDERIRTVAKDQCETD